MSDKLAVSTEDGRILFFSTALTGESEGEYNKAKIAIPNAQVIGQIGGSPEDFQGRIKDFEILKLPAVEGSTGNLLIVAGSSGGLIRLWMLDPAQFVIGSANSTEPPNSHLNNSPNGKGEANALNLALLPQMGRLLGTYETGNRITCLKAYIMSEPNDMKDVLTKDKGARPYYNDPEVDSNDSTSS